RAPPSFYTACQAGSLSSRSKKAIQAPARTRTMHEDQLAHMPTPAMACPNGRALLAAPLLLGRQGLQDGAGGHGQCGQADTDSVVDGVGQGRQWGDDGYLAHAAQPVGMARVGDFHDL